MASIGRVRLQVSRDMLIIGVALTLAAYEIIWGGARASVLTFVTGLLLSPLVLRVDQQRRNGSSP